MQLSALSKSATSDEKSAKVPSKSEEASSKGDVGDEDGSESGGDDNDKKKKKKKRKSKHVTSRSSTMSLDLSAIQRKEDGEDDSDPETTKKKLKSKRSSDKRSSTVSLSVSQVMNMGNESVELKTATRRGKKSSKRESTRSPKTRESSQNQEGEGPSKELPTDANTSPTPVESRPSMNESSSVGLSESKMALMMEMVNQYGSSDSSSTMISGNESSAVGLSASKTALMMDTVKEHGSDSSSTSSAMVSADDSSASVGLSESKMALMMNMVKEYGSDSSSALISGNSSAWNQSALSLGTADQTDSDGSDGSDEEDVLEEVVEEEEHEILEEEPVGEEEYDEEMDVEESETEVEEEVEEETQNMESTPTQEDTPSKNPSLGGFLVVEPRPTSSQDDDQTIEEFILDSDEDNEVYEEHTVDDDSAYELASTSDLGSPLPSLSPNSPSWKQKLGELTAKLIPPISRSPLAEKKEKSPVPAWKRKVSIPLSPIDSNAPNSHNAGPVSPKPEIAKTTVSGSKAPPWMKSRVLSGSHLSPKPEVEKDTVSVSKPPPWTKGRLNPISSSQVNRSNIPKANDGDNKPAWMTSKLKPTNTTSKPPPWTKRNDISNTSGIDRTPAAQKQKDPINSAATNSARGPDGMEDDSTSSNEEQETARDLISGQTVERTRSFSPEVGGKNALDGSISGDVESEGGWSSGVGSDTDHGSLGSSSNTSQLWSSEAFENHRSPVSTADQHAVKIVQTDLSRPPLVVNRPGSSSSVLQEARRKEDAEREEKEQQDRQEMEEKGRHEAEQKQLQQQGEQEIREKVENERFEREQQLRVEEEKKGEQKRLDEAEQNGLEILRQEDDERREKVEHDLQERQEKEEQDRLDRAQKSEQQLLFEEEKRAEQKRLEEEEQNRLEKLRQEEDERQEQVEHDMQERQEKEGQDQLDKAQKTEQEQRRSEDHQKLEQHAEQQRREEQEKKRLEMEEQLQIEEKLRIEEHEKADQKRQAEEEEDIREEIRNEEEGRSENKLGGEQEQPKNEDQARLDWEQKGESLRLAEPELVEKATKLQERREPKVNLRPAPNEEQEHINTLALSPGFVPKASASPTATKGSVPRFSALKDRLRMLREITPEATSTSTSTRLPQTQSFDALATDSRPRGSAATAPMKGTGSENEGLAHPVEQSHARSSAVKLQPPPLRTLRAIQCPDSLTTDHEAGGNYTTVDLQGVASPDLGEQANAHSSRMKPQPLPTTLPETEPVEKLMPDTEAVGNSTGPGDNFTTADLEGVASPSPGEEANAHSSRMKPQPLPSATLPETEPVESLTTDTEPLGNSTEPGGNFTTSEVEGVTSPSPDEQGNAHSSGMEPQPLKSATLPEMEQVESLTTDTEALGNSFGRGDNTTTADLEGVVSPSSDEQANTHASGMKTQPLPSTTLPEMEPVGTLIPDTEALGNSIGRDDNSTTADLDGVASPSLDEPVNTHSSGVKPQSLPSTTLPETEPLESLTTGTKALGISIGHGVNSTTADLEGVASPSQDETGNTHSSGMKPQPLPSTTLPETEPMESMTTESEARGNSTGGNFITADPEGVVSPFPGEQANTHSSEMKPQPLPSTTLPETVPAESSTTGTEAAGYHTPAEQTNTSVHKRTPSNHLEPANVDHPKTTVLSPRRILKSVFAWINRQGPINQRESGQKLTSKARLGSTDILVSKDENNSQVIGGAAAQVNLATHSGSGQQDTAKEARVNQIHLVEERDDSDARPDSTEVTISQDENNAPAVHGGTTASMDPATRSGSGQHDAASKANTNEIPLIKDHDTSEARPGTIGFAISDEETNSQAVVGVDTMPENLATHSVAGHKGITNVAYVSSSSEDDSSSGEESWLAPSMTGVSQERRQPIRIAAPSSILDLPPVAQSRSSRIDFAGSITDVSQASFRWLPPSMLSRINTDGELPTLVSVTNETISVYSNQSSAYDTPSLHESLTNQIKKPLKRENSIGASGLSRSDSKHFDVESSEGPLNSTRELSKKIDVHGVKSYSEPHSFRIQKPDGDGVKSFSESTVLGSGSDEDGGLGKRDDTEEPFENTVYRSPKVSFGLVEIMELPRDAPSEAFSGDIEQGQGIERSNKEFKRAGTSFCFKTMVFLIVVGAAATLVYVFLLSDKPNDFVPAATNTTFRPTSTDGPVPTPTTIEPNQAPQRSPTTQPSEFTAPSLPTTSDDVLLDLLTRASKDNGTSLRDPFSPQYAAMEWLRSTDNTGIYTDRRFLARYALATLYYSTNGKDWKNSTKWLTKSHECNWFYANPNSTSCNDRNFIQMDLTENNLQGALPPELSLLGLGRSQRSSLLQQRSFVRASLF
jgi:hypothetical protein